MKKKIIKTAPVLTVHNLDPSIRAKYGYLEAIVSIITNIGLFLLKLLLGLFINSIALIADGIHSLSDVSSSIIVLFGFHFSKKPPDENHPFGHGRIEYISTLLIATLLIFAALTILYQSIEKLLHPAPLLNHSYLYIIAIIVIITAVVKELLAQYSSYLARKIDSDMLKADAWHHRTDALSSIGVAISIIGAYYGYFILDSVFGIVIALLIIYLGIDLIKKASNSLIGIKPDEKIIKKIRSLTDDITDIHNVHKIILHDYGTLKIVTFHATFDKHLSLYNAHMIADELEKKIQDKLGFVAVIHLEPDLYKE
jgi:cation diffusion facilitator family transporter